MRILVVLLLISVSAGAQIDNIRKEAEKNKSSNTNNVTSSDSDESSSCLEGCVSSLNIGEACGQGCTGLFAIIGDYHTSILESNPSANGLQILMDVGRGDKFNAVYANGQLRGTYGLVGAGFRFWYFTDNYGYQQGINRKAQLSIYDIEFLHLNLISTENFALKYINSYTRINIVDSKGKPEEIGFYDMGGTMGLYSNSRKLSLEAEYRYGLSNQFQETPRQEFALRAVFNLMTRKSIDAGFFFQFRKQSYFGVSPYNFIGGGLSVWIH